VRPATQASVAISGDGSDWIVIGASPDIRQQILQTPRLWPRAGSRDSPIAAVVLIGGDVDALAGLLVLRERQAFTVYAPQPMLDLLEQNRIFDVLDRSLVRRQVLAPLEPTRPICWPARTWSPGLTATLPFFMWVDRLQRLPP
jgi:pyrroloquinoline quinone biosynthesis protein B